MVGGSNLGELFGAATVFFTAQIIPTPIPFIRLDAIGLLIPWYLAFFRPTGNSTTVAWAIGASLIPVSLGWAAGDVSLTAYIQASLAKAEWSSSGISALGSVMTFLYVLYVSFSMQLSTFSFADATQISIYTVLSPLLGLYVDKLEGQGRIYTALHNIIGVRPAFDN